MWVREGQVSAAASDAAGYLCDCSPLPMTCQPDANEPRQIPRGCCRGGKCRGDTQRQPMPARRVNHRTPPTAQRASHKRHAIDLILIIPCMYGLHVVVMCLEQAGPMTGHDQIPSPAHSGRGGCGLAEPGQAGLQVTRPLALTAPPSPWAIGRRPLDDGCFFEVSLGNNPALGGNSPRLPSERARAAWSGKGATGKRFVTSVSRSFPLHES